MGSPPPSATHNRLLFAYGCFDRIAGAARGIAVYIRGSINNRDMMPRFLIARLSEEPESGNNRHKHEQSDCPACARAAIF